MMIPETTSAEGFEGFVGGECLFAPRGDAWRDLKAWIVALPSEGHTLPLPSVSERSENKVLIGKDLVKAWSWLGTTKGHSLSAS
jgi:hypothetical protein